MRILFLESQPCIRALKYALGLKKQYSPQISFAYTHRTLSEFYGEGDELFEEWIKIKGEPNYALEKIFQEKSFDLIHSHNAPDNLAVAAIQAMKATGCKMPLIHDVHDMMSLRRTPYGQKSIDTLLDDEETAMKESDGLIFVSEVMQRLAMQKYRRLPLGMVFPNYLPKSLVPHNFKEKLSQSDGAVHIVYEGTLDSNTGSHYDLMEIFRGIAKAGFHIHIYPSKEHGDYKRLAGESPLIHYHEKLSPKSLLEELTKYDYGWAGFNGAKNREHLETVLPNKAVEYLAAGLPVISFDYCALREFIEKHNVGVVCVDINELGPLFRSQKMKSIQEEVKEKRLNFTLEENIPLIADFYDRVIRHFKSCEVSEEKQSDKLEPYPVLCMEEV